MNHITISSNSLRRLLVPTLAVASFAAPIAVRAELLIAVTATKLQQIDSAAPATVLQELPLSGLPAGASIIGADFGPIDDKLYVLIRDTSGRCSTLVLDDTGDTGVLGATGLPDLESCPAGLRDYERLRHEDSSKAADQLLAGGDTLHFQDPNEADGWLPWSLSSASGGAPSLAALAAENALDTSTENPKAVVGVDLGQRALVTVTPDEDTDGNVSATLTVIGDLGIDPSHFIEPASVSMDRTASGDIYLLLDGGLYSVSDDSGSATTLGTVPAGTIAVVEDRLGGGDGGDDDEDDSSGGGALGWLTLLGLATAIGRRRRD